MSHGLRRTLSHSAIYGVGIFAQNVVSLLMLPIYTRFLTPADYGTLGMMQIVVDIASAVFGLKLTQGVMRNFHASTTLEGKNTVIASALAFVMASKALGVVVLVGLAEPSARLLFGSDDLSRYMALFAISLLTSSLFFIPFQYLRATDRPVAFVTLSLLKLFLQLSLNIYFVVHLRMGVPGVIWATVINGVVLGGGMAVWLLFKTRFAVSLEQAKGLLMYSWPLIFAGFVDLYVGAGTRFLLSKLAGLSEVGLFMLAQRLEQALQTMVWGPFSQAWNSHRFQLVGLPNGEKTYARGFLMATVVLVSAGLALSLFAPEVLRLMSDEAFWQAARVVPVLVLAGVIGVATGFSRFGLVVEGRTVEFLRVSVIGALVATVVALALVGSLGAIGVAIAYVAKSLTSLWLLERKERSRFDVRLPWTRFWSLIGVAAAVYAVGMLAPSGFWAGVGYKLALYAAFLSIVFLSPIVGQDERRAIGELLQEALSRMRSMARSA